MKIIYNNSNLNINMIDRILIDNVTINSSVTKHSSTFSLLEKRLYKLHIKSDAPINQRDAIVWFISDDDSRMYSVTQYHIGNVDLSKGYDIYLTSVVTIDNAHLRFSFSGANTNNMYITLSYIEKSTSLVDSFFYEGQALFGTNPINVSTNNVYNFKIYVPSSGISNGYIMIYLIDGDNIVSNQITLHISDFVGGYNGEIFQLTANSDSNAAYIRLSCGSINQKQYITIEHI